ncbi:hypothetical protein [Tenacibaculum sp. 190524A02b]|uniref:hypothetical protein n=1 Tax=Tenacibaculum vairaonense TaxID=3137860 RepID=UPI0031FB36AC
MKQEHLKSKRLREVRSIWKRQREIAFEKRNLGYVKLDKPIRHGWFKEIVITQNIERYKSKEHILELYNVIEKRYWGKSKAHANKLWFNQVSKYLIYRGFPTISKKQFNKLSYKAQKMCTVYSFRNEQKKLKHRFYIRIPKGTYKIKFTRAYVTHSKRIDPELESEYALLNRKLLKRGYYEAEQKLYGYNDFDFLCNNKSKRNKIKRELQNLKRYSINDVVNEEVSIEVCS